MQTGIRGRHTNPRDPQSRMRQELLAKRDADREYQELLKDPGQLDKLIAKAKAEARAEGVEEGIQAGMDLAVESLLSLPEDELLAKRAEYQAEFSSDDNDQNEDV